MIPLKIHLQFIEGFPRKLGTMAWHDLAMVEHASLPCILVVEIGGLEVNGHLQSIINQDHPQVVYK